MQGNNADDVVEIDLQEVFVLLLHKLWLILLCGIVTGIAAFAISNFAIVPMYESTTKVYILNKQDNSTLSYSDLQLGTQLIKDYSQLIKSRTVLEEVIASCALEEGYGALSGRINVSSPTDTRIITITVSDDDPAMAQFLANEIRKVASDHIKNVMEIQAVNVVEEANLPYGPSSPNIKKWTGIGFLLGAFLCAALILIRFLLDDTIKTADDVERYLELSTLALIPTIEEEKTGKKKSRKRHSPDEETARYAMEKVIDEGTELEDMGEQKEIISSTAALEGAVVEEILPEQMQAEESSLEGIQEELSPKQVKDVAEAGTHGNDGMHPTPSTADDTANTQNEKASKNSEAKSRRSR